MDKPAFNLVRKILRSPRFLAQTIDQQQTILDEILLTGEITKEELNTLIHEALEEEQQQTTLQNNLGNDPEIQQLSKNLESLDYNSFLNIIRQGQIQGTDLLYLCNTSRKLRDYCNRQYEVRSNEGQLVQVIPNYLFVTLLNDKGIQVLPGEDAKEIYKHRVIGGKVYGFGGNWHNQLGLIDSNKTILNPTLNPTLNNIVQISAGTYHSLYLDNEGDVWGVGSNSSGQLGLGNTVSRDTPAFIKDLDKIVQVSAGYNHSLCLDSRGRVWAFGSNVSGQLGLVDQNDRHNPTLIPSLTNIIEVAVGQHHSLCLDNQGRVWSFGNNGDGELGFRDRIDRIVPTLIPNFTNIVKVRAGGGSSLCLDNQGQVWAFGSNSSGQLGFDNDLGRDVPTLIPNLNNITEISVGAFHTLCLNNQGHVWGFGSNNFGESGSLANNIEDINLDAVYVFPNMIDGLNNIVQVSVGEFHSLCLDNQGRIWTFGHGEYGQLGLGNDQNRNIPTLIPNLMGVFQISAGYHYSLILK